MWLCHVLSLHSLADRLLSFHFLQLRIRPSEEWVLAAWACEHRVLGYSWFEQMEAIKGHSEGAAAVIPCLAQCFDI